MNFPTHEPHYISVLLKIFYCSLLPLSSDFLISLILKKFIGE